MPPAAPPPEDPGSALRAEIHQARPFPSSGQEVVVAILRSAAVVQRLVARVVEPLGLTSQQYNVLRILRGAGPDGLPTLAIRDRMIYDAAGVTRLVDRLERARLVDRRRSTQDRRTIYCSITPEGRAIVDRLDASIDAASERAAAGLGVPERQALLALLGQVRAGAAER
jgi:MarR family transcriptional regulator, organic hydroperoxide resistance regulator